MNNVTNALYGNKVQNTTQGYSCIPSNPGTSRVLRGTNNYNLLVNSTTCSICLAAGTLIDIPSGPIPVEKLQVGVMVWTLNSDDQRVTSPDKEIGKTKVPANHQVVHLVLDDGRELWILPGHSTMDGRQIGQLQVDDPLDSGSIKSIVKIPYTGSTTFDLLPTGDTGFYWRMVSLSPAH